MRAYLPLIFELLIVGVVLGWGVRELWLLRREKQKDAQQAKDEDTPSED
ncbi:MAG: hypothetical protein ACLFQ5_10495 [Oceanicaulis sp.]